MKPLEALLSKYDVPAPRYTSYPTVPYWNSTPTQEQWLGHIQQSLDTDNAAWSMYIHVPYCESLCTFCGCNNIITKDHKREEPYSEMVLKEWNTYLEKIPQLKTKTLKHLHLGGGTPTFLSAETLHAMLSPILQNTTHDHDFEASIEVDPRRTNLKQLETLRKLGFNRISLGVQDFNPEVQRLVNRIQPFEITAQITKWARDLGYTSVNFDLIYGLAKQTPESIRDTAYRTVELRPDRIALYSFALVPWIKPQQRLFKDEDLPKAHEKRKLYEIAREILMDAGYIEVGMDHFALPTDSLAKALNNKTLHRNFMGYTDQKTDVLLGLGVSSISESHYSFHQNEKLLPHYQEKVLSNQLATHRGHVLNEQDQIHRNQILTLMTDYEVDINDAQKMDAQQFLAEMFNDELIKIEENKLKVTESGKPFLRNVCVLFDQHLREKQPSTKIFSQSI